MPSQDDFFVLNQQMTPRTQIEDTIAARDTDRVIERLRSALLGAADYLERLPVVPETRKLAAQLRAIAAPPEPRSAVAPEEGFDCLLSAWPNTPCGVRFRTADVAPLVVEAIVPVSSDGATKTATVQLPLTAERLDELIGYLCSVRRSRG